MDDGLVARWREGDPTATTAVRNGIRTVAERMLAHPTLRGVTSTKARRVADDEGQRREVTADIAREVMVRGGATAADVTAITIMVTARKLVELLRFERPFTGETHLPPQVAVSFALAPESLPKPSQEAAQRHTEECAGCAEDVRIVGSVVKSSPTQEPPAPVRPAPLPIPTPVGPSSADLLRELERNERPSRSGPTGARPAPTSNRADAAPRRRRAPDVEREEREPREPKASTKKSSRDQTPGDVLRAAAPVVGVVLLLGGMAWYGSKEGTAERYEKRIAIQGMAVRQVPVIQRYPGVESLEEYDAIVEALDRGDCNRAGQILRAVRARIGYSPGTCKLEAASWVCAGDGAAAVEAFAARSVEAENATFSCYDPWMEAQARLLRGDVDLALDKLLEAKGTEMEGSAMVLWSEVGHIWKE